MPIYDYICKRGHKTEALRGRDVNSIPCPVCGETACKCSVYRFNGHLVHSQESMGKKYRRFQEASAEVDYTCKKFESETNATVPNLGLWGQAKEKARGR